MIKVAKSNTAPESLTKTKAYDGEDVKRQLHVDQHSKCYICERILSTDFQVEHLLHRKCVNLHWNRGRIAKVPAHKDKSTFAYCA